MFDEDSERKRIVVRSAVLAVKSARKLGQQSAGMQLPSRHETRRATAEEFKSARSKALAHPWRHDMWMIWREREATLTEVAEEIGVDRELLGYHVRVLLGKEHVPYAHIELVGIDKKQGGTQHIYKAIEEPHVDMETAGELPRHVREESSKRVVGEMVDDLREALTSGSMDDEELRNLVRFHEELDEEGWAAYAALMDEIIERRKDINAGVQNRKAERQARGEDPQTTAAAFHLSQFPIPRRYRGGKQPG